MKVRQIRVSITLDKAPIDGVPGSEFDFCTLNYLPQKGQLSSELGTYPKHVQQHVLDALNDFYQRAAIDAALK